MNAPERMQLPVLPLKETVVFPESPASGCSR
jgi:hypothetical protein